MSVWSLESNVRSYSRTFPVVFARAEGERMWDEAGNAYIDFLSGAGALNYGHNPRPVMDALRAYVDGGGPISTLDLMTVAKRRFLEVLEEIALAPRGLEYRVQFTGPTGTNAVEAALKLARLATGRSAVVAFTNAFHGVTLGALAASAGASKRAAAGTALHDVIRLPFDGFPGGADAPSLLDAMLSDPGSGIEPPAAIIVETVQGEGGVHFASGAWLQRLAAVAQRHGSLLVADDIQAGCGRTGPFFSFERSGVVPDLVCLSKSIGGAGLPLSLVLIRPGIDLWEPGQHNGTFRGHNLAFVAATAALEAYWRDDDLEPRTERKGHTVRDFLADLAAEDETGGLHVRGRGLLFGLQWPDPERAAAVSRVCFEQGLIAETCGSRDQVLKLMPPLTISDAALEAGLEILARSVRALSPSRGIAA